ncbi:MAG TPA: hypothetical protein PL064_11795, partial [Thermogutta sp.]|nr:hypothetical protein [Thermogutta sp.]
RFERAPPDPSPAERVREDYGIGSSQNPPVPEKAQPQRLPLATDALVMEGHVPLWPKGQFATN